MEVVSHIFCEDLARIGARLCKNRARKGTYRVHVPSKSCMQDSCKILAQSCMILQVRFCWAASIGHVSRVHPIPRVSQCFQNTPSLLLLQYHGRLDHIKANVTCNILPECDGQALFSNGLAFRQFCAESGQGPVVIFNSV